MAVEPIMCMYICKYVYIVCINASLSIKCPFRTLPYNSRGMSVVVCTDVSGQETHREVGVGRPVTSGSLSGVMSSTLVQNARVWIRFPL